MSRALLPVCGLVLFGAGLLPATAQSDGADPGRADWRVKGCLAALEDEDDLVRSRAVDKLAELNAASTALEIVRQLDRKSPQLRQFALRAIGLLQIQAPVETIAPILKDPDPGTRGAAALALGRLGAKEYAKEVAQEVAPLLKDPDHRTRGAAAAALGQLGAKGYAQEVAALLKDPDHRTRGAAAAALGRLGAKGYAKEVAPLLEDPDDFTRRAAAEALAEMGAKGYAKEVAALLRDSDDLTRLVAGEALERFVPVGIDTGCVFLEMGSRSFDHVSVAKYRVYYYCGGSDDAKVLVRWLTRAQGSAVPGLDRKEGVAVLDVMERVWPQTQGQDRTRDETARSIADVVKAMSGWGRNDLTQLRRLHGLLQGAGSNHAAVIQETIGSLERWDWTKWVTKRALLVFLAHAAFWAGLILVYPRSRSVQAFFFWNPWPRKILGFPYVGMALRYVPFLRTRLFAPFRDVLLAEADLKFFQEVPYFEGVEVRERPRDRKLLDSDAAGRPAEEAIPELHGQVVLEGASGLGKSMFLRRLVARSKRVVVYLPASRCAEGVMPAIQRRLQGFARDADFLRDLIFAGAIDVCVDGLNEVSADTRAKIIDFADNHFKGNIALATQPLDDWTPPMNARVFVFTGLPPGKVVDFLVSRKQSAGTQDDKAACEARCREFVAEALPEVQSDADREQVQLILTNPMDLTVVAEMLARGEKPDVFRLREQQYRTMAADYQERNQGAEFPLAAFSEVVYKMRLEDQLFLSDDEFAAALRCMEGQKMVLRRSRAKADTAPEIAWRFRHEKIADYFIAQTFLGAENDRPQKHVADPRFRGVILLLATLMKPRDAKRLRDRLVEYAAESKDHSVSDDFVRSLKQRRDSAKRRKADDAPTPAAPESPPADPAPPAPAKDQEPALAEDSPPSVAAAAAG
jgi:hypothetical protein